MNRDYLPELGWPVYDLRRRKFGICIGRYGEMAMVHVEGDVKPRLITSNEEEYEYPKYYVNDAVTWFLSMQESAVYYIKHVHLHVPKGVWQYTIAQQGIDGFDRFTVDGDNGLDLVERHIPKI